MKIIKRDGRIVHFQENKIIQAVLKAFNEIDKNITETSVKTAKNIANYVKSFNKELKVEEIQDLVENKLMESNRKDVAKAYIIYRNDRNREREKNSDIIKKVMLRINATNVENANANVDEYSFSGREQESLSDIAKTIALEYGGLSKEVADAHKNMLVYQHDLEKAIYGQTNCLFINLGEIFRYGFKTRNGDVRPPTSFATACQLVAVAFQCQSQVQFGGVGSIHLDYDLAPFVKMSFSKHFKNGLEYIENWTKEDISDECIPINLSIEDKFIKESYPKVYKYALDMLEKEGRQATQALYHNLNTLESRQGSQVPFTSINLGRDTSPEGRLVTKWIFKASIDGIGGHHLTSIFPISIFQYKKGINVKPEDPNYDLKQLALESMSKRIYPNFVNCDWTQAYENDNDPDTFFSTMGCRTLIGYDRHGLGYIRQGRGNNVPNTIILPKLGIEYGICTGKRKKADLDGFWTALEKTLKICEKGLLERYDIIKKQSPKAAPFMYQNNVIKGADECKDTVENAVKHGTLGFGLIGIAEMCVALFGKNHAEDKEVHKFALSVVKRIYDYSKEASDRNNLNFGCYFTPAEGLCRTALKSLREQYGIIDGVTSHEYLTNSIHVPVWQKISIYDKLKIEAPFTKYATSGCITYIELESTFVKNTKAIEDIIDYAFNKLDIPYLAFNFPIDSCLGCGYQAEFNDKCPQCGSENIQQLRRVTGYLTTDYRNFNDGKQAEVKERVKHNVNM